MHSRSQLLTRDALAAAAILTFGLVLTLAGRYLWDETSTSSDTPPGIGPALGALRLDALLGLVSSAAGLAVVAGWLGTMSLAMVSALLEAAGRHGSARWTAAAAPAFMRRLALAVLGLSLVAGPAAHASSGEIDPTWQPTSAEAPHSAPSARPMPGLSAEPTPPAAPLVPVPVPAWTPPSSSLLGGVPARGPLVRAELRPAAATPGAVEVRPGDSLWSIASRHLGPGATPTDIADAWPRWFDANREAIGDDPDLIRPGLLLIPPDG